MSKEVRPTQGYVKLLLLALWAVGCGEVKTVEESTLGAGSAGPPAATVYDDCSACVDVTGFYPFTGNLYRANGDIYFLMTSFRCQDPTVDSLWEQLHYRLQDFENLVVENSPATLPNTTFTQLLAQQVIEDSANVWETPPGVALNIQHMTVPTAVNIPRSDSSIGYLPVAPGGYVDTLAYAERYYSSNDDFVAKITFFREEYDLALVSSEILWSAYGTPTSFSFKSILVHELGHGIGIGHAITNPQSVMGELQGFNGTAGLDSIEEYAVRYLYPAGNMPLPESTTCNGWTSIVP